MAALYDILINYGYLGMFLVGFLAGSFIPFSSETVMTALLAAGLNPAGLVAYGSAGNIAGGMFNYWIGSLGRLDWIERYLHVKQADINRAQRFMAGHRAWMGFFAFLPIIGSAITIALGLMRSNIFISLLSISIGKILRYIVLIYSVSLFL